MYGTHAELASQNIDTKQLLGLIRNKEDEDETNDEFTYDDNFDCSDIEDGMLVSSFGFTSTC